MMFGPATRNRQSIRGKGIGSLEKRPCPPRLVSDQMQTDILYPIGDKLESGKNVPTFPVGAVELRSAE